MNTLRYNTFRSSPSTSSSTTSSHGHGVYRGFKLKYARRFSVQRLRRRVIYLFKLLNKWRFSYGHALSSLKRSMSNRNSTKGIVKRNGSRKFYKRSNLMVELSRSKENGCSLRSLGGVSNYSFYNDAIADCLEFIKRSSDSISTVE